MIEGIVTAEIDALLDVALRSVRHPRSGLAAVLAAALRELDAGRVAAYFVPPRPARVELLGESTLDPGATRAPGTVSDPEEDLWRGFAAQRQPGDDPAVPVDWALFLPVRRVATPIGDGTCLFVAGPCDADDSAFCRAASAASLLAALWVAQRRADALGSELRDVRQARALLAAGLNHDLRTPLTSIVGSAKLMKERSEELTPAEIRELLDMIVRQGERMQVMIDDALVRAPHDPDAPLMISNVDVREIASRVATVARAARGGRVDVSVDGVVVRSDAGRLERILLNLVDNALKFSPDHAAHVVAEHRSAQVVITVADAGPGVNEEILPSLFHAYATDPARTDGVGLGLNSVVRLAAEIGAHVTYSRRDGWTRFALSLPASGART